MVHDPDAGQPGKPGELPPPHGTSRGGQGGEGGRRGLRGHPGASNRGALITIGIILLIVLGVVGVFSIATLFQGHQVDDIKQAQTDAKKAIKGAIVARKRADAAQKQGNRNTRRIADQNTLARKRLKRNVVTLNRMVLGIPGATGAPGLGFLGPAGPPGASIMGPQGLTGLPGLTPQDPDNGVDGRDGRDSTVPGPKGDKGDPCLSSDPACHGPAGADSTVPGPAIVSFTFMVGITTYTCTDPDGDLAYACTSSP